MHTDTHTNSHTHKLTHTQTHTHTHKHKKQVHIVSSFAAPGTLLWRLMEIDSVKHTAAAMGHDGSNETSFPFPRRLSNPPPHFLNSRGADTCTRQSPLITPNTPGPVHLFPSACVACHNTQLAKRNHTRNSGKKR